MEANLPAFLVIAAGFIVTPGPNVITIVSTSMQAGTRRGLQTVAGSMLAMAIQLVIAAVGTTWFLSLLNNGLFWLKWAGVVYLLYLGIRSLLRWARSESDGAVTATGSFQRGFWVSLTNPKTILFFSAFLPQFVNDSGSYGDQIAVLSFLFWLLALALDSGYALLAGRLRQALLFSEMNKAQNGISGALYVIAGTLLAGSNS